MTRKRLREILAEVQERMLLCHWHLEIDFDHTVAADGQIRWRWHYDYGILTLEHNWRQLGEGKARHLIAHELGHLIVRDLQVAVTEIEPCVPDSAWSMISKRYEHEIEGVVDRYASILYGREHA